MRTFPVIALLGVIAVSLAGAEDSPMTTFSQVLDRLWTSAQSKPPFETFHDALPGMTACGVYPAGNPAMTVAGSTRTLSIYDCALPVTPANRAQTYDCLTRLLRAANPGWVMTPQKTTRYSGPAPVHPDVPMESATGGATWIPPPAVTDADKATRGPCFQPARVIVVWSERSLPSDATASLHLRIYPASNYQGKTPNDCPVF